ncbi:alpha/beta fold hydrolase [Staphylococcus edaphicus]|uniref:Alpha/beta hydrolase n=1 Tax=Staphylococcus edaphicus TaxID=1955013 RepID=A0A2C6WRU7_9STAP|nr:alpha/beta hydrolase [Staphylococcus edaphicus]PHK50476.1 alpha/beta hydrolase [Staphylococcus edaphicus]UQW81161.1 alpha/beta hydrolase [Staphylococcus edaphicus]
MEKIATNCNNEIAYIREGQGFPVILIHGLDGNMASLYSLKDALKHSFDVIVYDVRGHGKSTKRHSFNLEDHVEDLKALMTKLDISSAHLIGHDMGGLIAKHFTDKYKTRVATLTLIACNLIDSVHALNKLMIDHQEEIEGFDKSEALILLLPYMYKEKEKAKKWYQNQLIYSRQTADDSAVATRALMEFPVLKKDVIIKQTDVPTLIVNGVYDPLMTNETIEKYNYAFTRLQMQSFNASGHAPHIEEPKHFLDVYNNFIMSQVFQKE